MSTPEAEGPSPDRPDGTAVLIVNFKAYAFLRRCLASVVPQLGEHDEIIVVDQETEQESLGPILRDFPAVRDIALPTNIGFASAVNLAAARTEAPYLLLLNPDAVLESSAITHLRDLLAESEGAGVAGPRVVNEDGSLQASARRFPDFTTLLGGRTSWLSARFPQNWFAARNLVGRDARQPMRVDWVSGACLMTRRDVFTRLGGLDELFFLYWEDADYCRRALAAGFHTIYTPGAIVRHTVGASSSKTQDLATRAFHASALRMFRKHASPTGRLVTPVVRAALLIRQRLRLRSEARRAGLSDVPLALSSDDRRRLVPAHAPGAEGA